MDEFIFCESLCIMTNLNAQATSSSYKVGFFVTCLVDLFRPSVGFASIKLLEDAGCSVEVPVHQTCCGQPAFNSGDKQTAQDIAKQVIESFETFDYVVAPSGSCAATLKIHYPELFEDDKEWLQKARSFSAKVYELTSFLVDVMKITSLPQSFEKTVTYHDSCSGLRELNIQKQPRHLLEMIEGLRLEEMADSDVCCGFGGTFCVKYPDISNSIVERKTDKITNSGAQVLLAGDLGCLMNMAGKLSKDGQHSVSVRHVAEVLAGMTDEPAVTKNLDSET